MTKFFRPSDNKTPEIMEYVVVWVAVASWLLVFLLLIRA